MKKIVAATLLMMVATVAQAASATLVNRDGEAQVVTVTEGSNRVEVSVDPEQSVDFCPAGCFVTLPNGDRQALEGGETIEIRGGAAFIQ